MSEEVKVQQAKISTAANNGSSSVKGDTRGGRISARLSSMEVMVQGVINSIMQTRRYMIWSSLGRLVLLLTLFFIGVIGAHRYSPTHTLIMIPMGISVTFSSIMQVMIATEISAGMLPKKKRSNDDGSSVL